MPTYHFLSLFIFYALIKFLLINSSQKTTVTKVDSFKIFAYIVFDIFTDLVASWVTGTVGHSGGLRKSARLDDDELEPR